MRKKNESNPSQPFYKYAMNEPTFEDDKEKVKQLLVKDLTEQLKAKERFTMPTDKQVIDIAILFNDGKLDAEKLSDMVAMCQFVIDRLHENGDVTTPSKKEI